jgi:hypothetical protein
MSRRLALVFLCGLLMLLPAAPAAHEIPNEVTIQTFLKPEGQRLTLLVRAPLKAMREMRVPQREQGFLDLAQVDPVLRAAAATWIVPLVKLYEGDRELDDPELLSIRVSLPADRSFDSYDAALRHMSAPAIDPSVELYWEEGLVDAAFSYRIQSDQSQFSISNGFTRLGMRVNVVLRFLPPGGAERAFDVHGDAGVVRLDPRWHQAALRFVEAGFYHILDGIDHLLFLFCLVIPFRRVRPLVIIVTAFTVAHSITLIASAFNMAPSALWFPPLVETLIATSIVYMGLENIVIGWRPASAVSPKLGVEPPPSKGGLERRWLLTFGFGLIHGFGFSFALEPAVCRRAFADLAAGVQRRRGDRPTAGAGADASTAGAAVSVCARRADWDHHPVRAGRAHGLALDDRSRITAAGVSVPVAGV